MSEPVSLRDFTLTGARISIRKDIRGEHPELVIGGDSWASTTRFPLTWAQTFELACRDLPESEKSYYIKELTIIPVPKGWEHYVDRVDFRYDIFETYPEARTALKEMLQEMIENLNGEES